MIYAPIELGAFAEIGNAPGLAGTQTGWVIGCSAVPNIFDTDTTAGVQTIPGSATFPAGNQPSNCGTASGGTYNTDPGPRTAASLLTSATGFSFVPGALSTPGGNRTPGSASWSRSNSSIVGVVNWDAASTSSNIFPGSTIPNCNSSIRIKDTVLSGASNGRAGAGCDVVAVDPNLRIQYVETWTLSIQHAILNNLVLDVAYVGNHGALLIGRKDLNTPVVGAGLSPAYIANCIATKTSGNCDGNNGTSNDLSNDARPFAGTFNKTVVPKFPYLNIITSTGNFFTSNYNAVQMTLTARNYHGLSSVLGYTFGKALEVTSDNTGFATDPYNVSYDYGKARNDLTHRMTLSSVYQVPSVMGYGGLLQGWRLNAIFRKQSGQNWTAGTSGDFTGTGTRQGSPSRWDFDGDPKDFKIDYRTGGVHAVFHPTGATAPAPTATGTNFQVPGTNYTDADLAINTALCTAPAAGDPNKLATLQAFGCYTQGASAITPPPLGRFGNMGKGIFWGPGYWNLDFSVTKRHQITERYTAEFRVETFNIFNHPTFSNPSTGLGCSASGCAFSTVSGTPNVGATNPFLGSGGPRRMQFGVKIIF
jgi:hypothetical protein